MNYFVYFTFITNDKMDKKEGNAILNFDFEVKDIEHLKMIKEYICSKDKRIKKDSVVIVSLNKL